MTDADGPESGLLVLSRYRIVRLLAEGGMGAVYLARVEGAAGFSKPIVVKRILPHLTTSPEEQMQFIREARILSQLRHPGIVDVIDFGKQDGAYYMVLEYVPGYHLGQWLTYITSSSEWMPWDMAVFVMIQVLSALHYAHSYVRTDGSHSTIVHRDVSPSNILIDIDGNVRIVDFGIARMDVEHTPNDHTSRGEFRGKLSYAAPEQLACESASPSTDTYACAVVLYQLLSGTNPFAAQEPAAVVRRVMAMVPAPVSSVRRDIPAELDAVLSRALAKSKEERYASAQDFAAALRALLPSAESEISARLVVAVRKDFRGGLASRLKLSSLEELDAAWRRASGYPVERLPSMPTVRVGTARTPRSLDMTGLAAPPVAAFPPPPPPAEPPRPANRGLLLVVAGATVLASVAVILAVLALQPKSSTEPRFVVVESSGSESHHDDGGEASASSSLGVSAGGTPTESAVGTSSVVPGTVTGDPSDRLKSAQRSQDTGSTLTRQFSKRQGAIEQCFQSNTSKLDGAPQISIRFSIDATGKVLSAAVKPEPIATTALGQCIEHVARATNFGPQEKALAFSIPITARVR